MHPEIKQPVFVVGCPRSGTGALGWQLAEHHELATFTNNTVKYPTHYWITRFIRMCRIKEERPSEGHRLWDSLCTHGDDTLRREDATDENAEFVRESIRTALRIFKKPRFINKCPTNALRLPFFDEIFPDAYFVHIVRDGRAVAHSILRKRERHDEDYWGARPPGWQAVMERPLIEGCGLQWKLFVTHALDLAEQIPEERYIEVRYESYVEDPAGTLKMIAERCGLAPWEPDVLRGSEEEIQSRNYKWKENFTQEQIAALNEIQGDLLERLGYEV